MSERIHINQKNPYESSFEVVSKEQPFVEKDGKIWQKLTLQSKETHNLAWKTAKGIAAFFATLGTFIIGAFLINGIRNLWQEAISGREIIEIEKELASPDQKKADDTAQTVLKTKTVDVLPNTKEENRTSEIDLREENRQKIIKEIKAKLSENNPLIQDRFYLDPLVDWQEETDLDLKKKIALRIAHLIDISFLDKIDQNAFNSIKNGNFSREALKQQFDYILEIFNFLETAAPEISFEEAINAIQEIKDHFDLLKGNLSTDNPLNTDEFIIEIAKANKYPNQSGIVKSFIKNSTNLSEDKFQELIGLIDQNKLKENLTALYEFQKKLPPNSPFLIPVMFSNLEQAHLPFIFLNSIQELLNNSYISDDHLKTYIRLIKCTPKKQLDIQKDLLWFNQFRAKISLENPLATVHMINLLKGDHFQEQHLKKLFYETRATLENLDELYEATTLERNKEIIRVFRDEERERTLLN